ncbi:MAG: YfcE family phosphodiesterase [Candidatus Omnitrophica bacterium]|nr:YfcE family phosphodiesterase [Candidatus Omnitrophota bacterium]
MKIGVIADTHIPVSAKKLPPQVYENFKGCDLIIHAGDLVSLSVLTELEKIAETKAVRGNMDGHEVREKLPEKLFFEFAGKKIGVMHGRGPAMKVWQIVREAFGKKADIIIFGHSHNPRNERKGGVLLFNPGSPTDTVFSPYRSIGIIEIEGDDIRSEIIKIDG